MSEVSNEASGHDVDPVTLNNSAEVVRQHTERLDPSSFPHRPKAGTSHLPTTIENIRYLVDQVGYRPTFDVIKKRLALRRADGSPASVNEIISLASLHGLNTGLVLPFVEEIAHQRPYNPVAEWIDSRPWDSVDRLPAFFETVTTREGYPGLLKTILLKRWILSVAAAAIVEDNFQTRGVLTLQGPQGVGKTRWVSALVPQGLSAEWVKRDHHLDGSSKDSVIGAITHWIVEIGELDSSFKKDVARLKGFLTSNCDKIRRPYGREEAEYPRRTVFAATVNDEAFSRRSYRQQPVVHHRGREARSHAQHRHAAAVRPAGGANPCR